MGEQMKGGLPMMVPAVGYQKQPFDLAEATRKTCPCGSELFEKIYRIGIISKMAPNNLTRMDISVEYPTYICQECGVELGKEK